jgi:hypothetical protein
LLPEGQVIFINYIFTDIDISKIFIYIYFSQLAAFDNKGKGKEIVAGGSSKDLDNSSGTYWLIFINYIFTDIDVSKIFI